MANTRRLATVIIAAAFSLAACTAQYSSHGYAPAEADLQQIVPGVDTRATVEEVIGVPTTSGVLNEGGFYYISSEIRTFGWKAPEEVNREVVAVTFDSAGVVENITRYGLEDGNVVPLSRRITRTSDGEVSFIRKLFGNIGGLNLGGLTSDGL
ncbi:outer membrane protein assembly factor BamE [Citreicella sp. C3M06]|uniref:outer membrane protein assembly factor BamE n=1 Tax=Roseobacteraceae TaxID=2854170 RepID=UPI001C08E301|nr:MULTISPECIES: outer membrane protein assembly factor BamE [Roseobacteraceae]MBU2963387.1 outer membrane protein assembly factor BamE [Citreicella sp. C3M06]MDO6585786.1 outer membrane protein assembly factor BamE [Salipiger sp. 1_MG-2023]